MKDNFLPNLPNLAKKFWQFCIFSHFILPLPKNYTFNGSRHIIDGNIEVKDIESIVFRDKTNKQKNF